MGEWEGVAVWGGIYEVVGDLHGWLHGSWSAGADRCWWCSKWKSFSI